MAQCEHTITDEFGAILQCVSQNTRGIRRPRELVAGLPGVWTYYYCPKHIADATVFLKRRQRGEVENA